MNRCLKITFGDGVPDGFLRSFVQKHARSLALEGTAQRISSEGRVRVVVCGKSEMVDKFLDVIHKGSSAYRPDDVEVEPFLRDKDYRGVFRVIE